MPSLSYAEVKNWSSSFKPEIFVETGTFLGHSVDNVCNHFESVQTIELSEKYASLATRKYASNPKIHVIHGDSATELVSLCGSLAKTTFFWLDGHYSSGDTAQGSKDCPLLEECYAIAKYCKPECIVAIDDVRLFDKKLNENWLGITRESIVSTFNDRILSVQQFPSSLHNEDRMVIHIKAI